MTTAHPGGAAPTQWWRRLLHPFVVMPVVALLAVGIWWFGFHSSGTKSSAAGSIVAPQLVAVTSGTLNATVSAQGTIAALATDALSFSSSGKVTAVNVKAGDSVTAGEVLATLDSASLQASVSSAQASLAQAQAKYSDDSDAGASSQQLAADAATVTTASDALTNAHTALTGASLIADFDGVVASVNITVGQQLGSSGAGATSVSGSGSGTGNSSANVGTGTATNNQNRAGASASASSSTSSSSSSGQINITTSGVYKVDLAVSSADISKIAIGQTATLTVTTSSNSSGFGGRNQATTNTTRASATSGTTSAATAQGAVTSVGAVASASSGVATFPVTVAFKADPTQFFVGGSVIADIVTSTTGTVVMVPVRAVTTAQDGTRTVELSTDGTVNHTKTVTVTTGTTSNGMIEIRSGLQVGDKVVAAGLSASSGSGTSTGIGSFGGSGQSRTGP